ncbi:sialate O-acetylesterase [Portibacter marinus]|uniref:sialate O-acetylesterase n=1 Tax=Portibacter marinus TaxID=2898660 RepID=UPI001F2B89CA|nr:sialate O-acetylesterase [Portibacter marinus]
MRPINYALTFFLLPLILSAQENAKDTFRLFYLGGQSNMDGFGLVEEVPDSIHSNLGESWIFHGHPAPDGDESGGLGIWAKLLPGQGWEFSATEKENNLSGFFGPELSFAKKLQEYYPNDKIAIIKYSRGGTSIDSVAAGRYGSWEPDFKGQNGINQYDHFLKTLQEAMKVKDIDGNGVEDVLIPSGILWMQGESDAYREEVALRYYDNLKRLMDLVRAALRVDDLPLVIGKITDSGKNDAGKVFRYSELVQYAQEKYARTEQKVAIVRSTQNYGYYDAYHYDSSGYIDLGEKFAEAIYKLNRK